MSRPLTISADPIDAQARIAAKLVDPADVGLHVSEDVIETLERCFPEVQVCWHTEMRRFWLVQTLRDGRRQPFRMLGTVETPEWPTPDNTVGFVARLAAIRSKADQQRWLDEIDATSGIAEIEKNARERIREGARDLYPHLFKNRVLVARPNAIPDWKAGRAQIGRPRRRR